MTPKDFSEILKGFKPGDCVRVEWPSKETPRECYQEKGTVVQVTDRFVVIRSPGGYRFCVAVYDLACGTRIVLRKAAVA
ncbi:MAG: hypothetical protein ACPLTR_08970 [Thermacetogeniaceae bacterium]